MGGWRIKLLFDHQYGQEENYYFYISWQQFVIHLKQWLFRVQCDQYEFLQGSNMNVRERNRCYLLGEVTHCHQIHPFIALKTATSIYNIRFMCGITGCEYRIRILVNRGSGILILNGKEKIYGGF